MPLPIQTQPATLPCCTFLPVLPCITPCPTLSTLTRPVSLCRCPYLFTDLYSSLPRLTLHVPCNNIHTVAPPMMLRLPTGVRGITATEEAATGPVLQTAAARHVRSSPSCSASPACTMSATSASTSTPKASNRCRNRATYMVEQKLKGAANE